jgi:hypothetical protein
MRSARLIRGRCPSLNAGYDDTVFIGIGVEEDAPVSHTAPEAKAISFELANISLKRFASISSIAARMRT